MEQNKVNTFAAKFKKAFSEVVLNELGKATRYCHRVRQLTPYRMVMTLMALLAGTRVESLADLQRGFNALFGFTMDYKPFYDQLAKREFATFMRETARRLLETLVIRVLGVAPGGAFSEFRRIVIQDGSSFAIKDALKEVFPGRFKKVKPAAVELHATLDLLDESLSKVTLTADTASERTALPKASSLGGSLLLADRGYFDRDYLSELTKAGASFVIRAPKGLNPKVLEAFDAKGQRIRQFCGKPLKTLRIAKRGAVDLQVGWEVPGQSLECRLIVAWNATTNEFQYLATNLPPGRYSVSEVAKAYRLRWQVEGMEVLRESPRLRYPEPRHRRRAHLGGDWGCRTEALPRPHGPGRGRCRDLHPKGGHVRCACPSRYPAHLDLRDRKSFPRRLRTRHRLPRR